MSTPALDRDVLGAIEAGLLILVGGNPVSEVRVPDYRNGGDVEQTLSGYFSDIKTMARAVVAVDGAAPAIYATLNAVQPKLLERSPNRLSTAVEATKAGDILGRTRILIDLDPTRPAGASSTDVQHQAALDRGRAVAAWLIERGVPAASIALIDSGNGCHAYVAVNMAPGDGALVRRFLRTIAGLFDDDIVHVDTGVCDAPRLVKIPGTMACKGANTPETPHRRSRVIEAPERLTPAMTEIIERIAGPAEAVRTVERDPARTTGGGPDRAGFLARWGVESRGERTTDTGLSVVDIPCPFNAEHGWDAWVGEAPTGMLSAECHHVPCFTTWAELREHFEPEWGRRTSAPHETEAGRPAVAGATTSEATEPTDDFYPAARPEIVDRKDPEVFREAESALLAWPECGVYSRGSLLVKIVRTGEATFSARKTKTVHRPANAPAIAPVDPVFLCSRMGRAARWVRLVPDKRGAEGFVKIEADPPMRIAREIAAENVLRFPVLEGVAEAPVFLPSGEVLERPGYDAETGLWYAPAADYPPVPSKPDHAAAFRAALEILDPFDQFPFVEDIDRAAFLAYVLTPLARTAIDESAPMTSFDSPVRGSGKSKLATCGGTIGTGREPALMVPTDDEEELRKAALAFGLEGTRLCIIDNAAGAFGSKQLAAILTLRTISGRVLGLSKTATVPLRVVWAITGNNLTFKGDLARRIMHVRIDPKMEHPEHRKDFRIPNLSAYVRDERARLIVAGLTILRAFHIAGRPHNGRPGRGFEAWCALVRSAVEWTLKVDPWPESPDGGDDNDAEHEDLRRALLAWEETFGALPTTAAAACVRAAGNPDLAATLAQFVGVPVVKLDARGLGFRIRHRLGQIADGRRFVRGGEDRIAGVKWAVRTTDTDA
jgi:hypothetical protein